MSHIEDIVHNFTIDEENLFRSLGQKEKHPAIAGDNREEMWFYEFKKIIPNKFFIKQNGFVMDSFGEVSKEIDIIIYDKFYSIEVFKNYIPIESVYAVVQVKSNNSSSENIQKWIDSIEALSSSSGGKAGSATGLMIEESRQFSPLRILLSNTTISINEEVKKKFDLIYNEEELIINTRCNVEQYIRNDNNSINFHSKTRKVTSDKYVEFYYELNEKIMLYNNSMIVPLEKYRNLLLDKKTI